LPLELLEDVIGEWLVEIRGHGELTRGQAVRAGFIVGGREGLDFRQGLLTPDNEKKFSRFDTPKEGKGVALDFLHADGTHGSIIAEEPSERLRHAHLPPG
jgi:hypothetical protein